MLRFRMLILLVVGAVLGVIAIGRRSHSAGHAVAGGVLISDTGAYDRLSHALLGGLFRGIAADIAAAAPTPARVLEVGCGPGQLAIELTRSHGLEVTGLDLDPAMIDRARANADASADGEEPTPTFVVGDVAALPFEDASFDVVVSTFSMHHWSDQDAGLREIARVLQPGGQALIWDLRPGVLPFHPEVDTASMLAGSPLGRATITSWHWPGPLTLAHRAAFTRD
jgi:ubiquinone/menaquinone biosynthesis C-methylase UbiE